MTISPRRITICSSLDRSFGSSMSMVSGATIAGEMNLEDIEKGPTRKFRNVPKEYESAHGGELCLRPYSRPEKQFRRSTRRCCMYHAHYSRYVSRDFTEHSIRPSDFLRMKEKPGTHGGSAGMEDVMISKNDAATNLTFSKFCAALASPTSGRSGSNSYDCPGGSEAILLISGMMRLRRYEYP